MVRGAEPIEDGEAIDSSSILSSTSDKRSKNEKSIDFQRERTLSLGRTDGQLHTDGHVVIRPAVVEAQWSEREGLVEGVIIPRIVVENTTGCAMLAAPNNARPVIIVMPAPASESNLILPSPILLERNGCTLSARKGSLVVATCKENDFVLLNAQSIVSNDFTIIKRRRAGRRSGGEGDPAWGRVNDGTIVAIRIKIIPYRIISTSGTVTSMVAENGAFATIKIHTAGGNVMGRLKVVDTGKPIFPELIPVKNHATSKAICTLEKICKSLVGRVVLIHHALSQCGGEDNQPQRCQEEMREGDIHLKLVYNTVLK